MTGRAFVLIMALVANACSGGERQQKPSDRILAISFPGIPNPPTKNLVRGTGNFAQIQAESSPESQISEAFLRCGLRGLSWTSYGTDGGSRLIMQDNEESRSAVKCVAKIFPLDFYAEPQRASKSDLTALTQTP